jgi:hypothetical protein
VLTRKQLRMIQIARGLSMDAIVQKSGIPMQSLVALIGGSEKEGKDPKKLISQATYEKVLSIVGIGQDFEGLRTGVVIEWTHGAQRSGRGETSWVEAIKTLRKELFSEEIELAEIRKTTPFYRKGESLLLLHDAISGVRIVFSDCSASSRRFLESTFDARVKNLDVQTAVEFGFTKELIRNGVYRCTQFNIALGGNTIKYNWADVQAAAREFNFHTDDLINMMVETVQRSEAGGASTHQIGAEPLNRVVALR